MMPHPQPQAGLEESAQALATLNRLSYLRNQSAHRELTRDEQEELATDSLCVHCGGHHARACPRVKRIVFRQGGAGVQEVEYFPAAEIDWTGVLFEDVGEAEETDLVPVSDIRELANLVLHRWAGSGDNPQIQMARRVSSWLDQAEQQAVQSGHGQAAG